MSHLLMAADEHTFWEFGSYHWYQEDFCDTGPPQLMMSFTADGQVNEQKLKETHDQFGYVTEDIRKARESVSNWCQKIIQMAE